MKSTSGLIKHLNTYKVHNYLTIQLKISQEHPMEEDVIGENWEDESELLDETDNIATTNGIPDIPTKDMSWKRLLASEFSSMLSKEQFSSYEFSTDTWISDIIYKHPRSKHKSSFYPFNEQLDYALVYYFVELETTKGNVNKFLINPLIAPLTKKLSYKNADKQMEKLSEIPWGIPEDKQTEHKFNVKSGVSGIAGQEIVI